MLNGHIDVFPVGDGFGWTRDPWGGEIVGGKIYGRGAADMKCGTSASIITYALLHRIKDQLKGKLTLTGGKRSRAGRPKGAKSAKTLEIARKAIESGLTPLEYMMDILRDVNQPKELRFEAAKSAAPYIHPRLAHIESKNETTVTKVVSPEPTTTEWEEEFTERLPN